MKRRILLILLSFLIVFSIASPKQKTYAANISDNSVIILSGKMNEQKELVIDANLTVNTGIAGMTLELVYDTEVMTLSNVQLGTALASLEPMTTNTKTELGYSITPFKFNYFGKENDFSTGKLFTLTFTLDENIGDGNYSVSLKYDKNQDVNYFGENGEVKTKNLYLDNTEVEIKNNSVIKIVSIKHEEPKSLTWIVILCFALAVVASVVVVVVILLNKRRNWKRL